MSDEIEEVVEIEEEARKLGWVKQEEWKGDPDKWRPAEEFVERGRNIVPIMRERLEKLEKELRLSANSTRKN